METPVPRRRYLPAKRFGSLIVTSGMTPRKDGVLTATGKVAANEPPEMHKDAVLLAVGNALAVARAQARAGETVTEVVQMTVFVAAEPDFEGHSALADIASDYLIEELGTAGIGARAAVGAASLPGNALIEIVLVAMLGQVGSDADTSR